MPNYFKINGQVGEIPEEKAIDFKRKYPDAEEMFKMDVDGNVGYIPVAKESEFVKKYPNSKNITFGESPFKDTEMNAADRWLKGRELAQANKKTGTPLNILENILTNTVELPLVPVDITANIASQASQKEGFLDTAIETAKQAGKTLLEFGEWPVDMTSGLLQASQINPTIGVTYLGEKLGLADKGATERERRNVLEIQKEIAKDPLFYLLGPLVGTKMSKGITSPKKTKPKKGLDVSELEKYYKDLENIKTEEAKFGSAKEAEQLQGREPVPQLPARHGTTSEPISVTPQGKAVRETPAEIIKRSMEYTFPEDHPRARKQKRSLQEEQPVETMAEQPKSLPPKYGTQAGAEPISITPQGKAVVETPAEIIRRSMENAFPEQYPQSKSQRLQNTTPIEKRAEVFSPKSTDMEAMEYGEKYSGEKSEIDFLRHKEKEHKKAYDEAMKKGHVDIAKDEFKLISFYRQAGEVASGKGDAFKKYSKVKAIENEIKPTEKPKSQFPDITIKTSSRDIQKLGEPLIGDKQAADHYEALEKAYRQKYSDAASKGKHDEARDYAHQMNMAAEMKQMAQAKGAAYSFYQSEKGITDKPASTEVKQSIEKPIQKKVEAEQVKPKVEAKPKPTAESEAIKRYNEKIAQDKIDAQEKKINKLAKKIDNKVNKKKKQTKFDPHEGTVIGWVKGMGGLKSEHVKEYGYDDTVNKMISGGKYATDDLAHIAIEQGVIPRPPEGMPASDWLMEHIGKRSKMSEHLRYDNIDYDTTIEFARHAHNELGRDGIIGEDLGVETLHKMFKKNKNPLKVHTADLEVGDKFTIAGEKYKVTKKEDGKLTLKDGETRTVEDMFEFVTIDDGSLVKGKSTGKEVLKEKIEAKKVEPEPTAEKPKKTRYKTEEQKFIESKAKEGVDIKKTETMQTKLDKREALKAKLAKDKSKGQEDVFAKTEESKQADLLSGKEFTKGVVKSIKDDILDKRSGFVFNPYRNMQEFLKKNRIKTSKRERDELAIFLRDTVMDKKLTAEQKQQKILDKLKTYHIGDVKDVKQPMGEKKSTTKGYNEKTMHKDLVKDLPEIIESFREEFNKMRGERLTFEQTAKGAMEWAARATDADILNIKRGETRNAVETLGARIYSSNRLLEVGDRLKSLDTGKGVLKNLKTVKNYKLAHAMGELEVALEMYMKSRALYTEAARVTRSASIRINDSLFEGMNKIREVLKEIDPEQADFLADLMKKENMVPGRADKVLFWFYNSILSSPYTDLANLTGNTSHLSWEIFTSTFTNDPRVTARMFKAIPTGLKNGIADAMAIYKGEEAIISKFSNGMDMNRYDLRPKNAIQRALKATLPTTRLAMEDAIFKGIAREMKKDMTTKQTAIDKKISFKEAKARVKEIMEDPRLLDENSSVYQDILDYSNKYAKYVTFQESLKSDLGKALQSTNFIKPLIPFPRVMTNILKANYKNTPLGLFKLRFGEEAKTMTGFEKKDIKRRAVAGTIALAALYYSMTDNKIQITGNGPKFGTREHELWELMGYKPNHIYWVSDDGEMAGISYQNINPFNNLFAVLGNWQDEQRFNKRNKIDEKSLSEQLTSTLSGAARTMSDQSFMLSISNMFDWMEGKNDHFLEDLVLMPWIPNVLTAPRVTKGYITGDKPRYEADSFKERVQRKMGIYHEGFIFNDLNPVYDTFGKQKQSGYERFPFFPTKTTDDTVVRFLTKQGLTVGSAGRYTKIGNEIMPNSVYPEYVRRSGKMIYEYLSKNMIKLKRMDLEKAQSEIDRNVNNLRSSVKQDLAKELGIKTKSSGRAKRSGKSGRAKRIN